MNVYRWENDEAARETIRKLEEEKSNAKTWYEKFRASLKEQIFLAGKELEAREKKRDQATEVRKQWKAKLDAANEALSQARQQLEAARARAGKEDATPNARLTLKLAEAQVASREADVRETKTQWEGAVRLEQWWSEKVAQAKDALDKLQALWLKLTGDGAQELERRNQQADRDIDRLRALMAHNASRSSM